jgi:hypothetical protein
MKFHFNKIIMSLNYNSIIFSRWVSLQNAQDSFLSSYLHRNLVHFQTNNSKHKDSCIIMERVVTFLVEVYKLINDQIVKFGFNEHTLSKFYEYLIISI